MMRYLLPDAVFDGDVLRTGLAVTVEDDIVVFISEAADLDPAIRTEAVNAVLAPGLFDVQVNGGGGVMLNNDPSPAGVRAIALAHRSVGTAFTLPTVITDRPEITERAADAVLQELGKNGVLGIHVEGPHISLAHKGTHNPDLIRPFDAHTMSLMKWLRERNVPVLLTVAPETMQPGEITSLVRMGVVVSGGHSAATAEQTEAALAEGMSSFTHLFNGMPQMTSRKPGIVGAAINSDAFCGIIADGHHVDDRMIALACRARPTPRRMVLVSDAMSTVAGPDRFELYGEIIRVDGGKLVNARGSLAGAHIDLKTSVQRMVANVGIPLADALAAATSTPRDLIGLPRQSLVGSSLNELFFYSSS